MKLKLIMMAVGITFLAASCGETEKNKSHHGPAPMHTLKEANFMIGNWQQIGDEGVTLESWRKESDTSYSGLSYFVAKGDTLSSEKIRLVQRGDNLQYIPIVDGQNNNLGIEFKLIGNTGNSLIFENAYHDFPQMITYTNLGRDSMVAEISGNFKGKMRKEKFPMGRIKNK